MALPKLIWQTWKDANVPERWRAAQQSVIAANPGWRYTLLTDDDNRKLVARYFPGYLDTYDAFPHPIQRADVIRYVVLYLFGGIYLDLDFKALKGFDSMDLDSALGEGEVGAALSANSIFGRKNVTNSFMVSAAPRNPFWLRVLDETSRCVPAWADILTHTRVFWSTGPWALGRASRSMPGVVKFLDVQVPCDICSLEADTCDIEKNGSGRGQGYVLEPIRGSSWQAADTWTTLYCRWPELLACSGLALVAIRKLRN